MNRRRSYARGFTEVTLVVALLFLLVPSDLREEFIQACRDLVGILKSQSAE